MGFERRYRGVESESKGRGWRGSIVLDIIGTELYNRAELNAM